PEQSADYLRPSVSCPCRMVTHIARPKSAAGSQELIRRGPSLLRASMPEPSHLYIKPDLSRDTHIAPMRQWMRSIYLERCRPGPNTNAQAPTAAPVRLPCLPLKRRPHIAARPGKCMRQMH